MAARLALLGVLLAALLQGCSSRQCTSHMKEEGRSHPCHRECLSHDQFIKCLCEQSCPCWSFDHPDFQ
jgi:hypothetical protein